MQTGNTDLIYKNELDKACFQHNMVYGKSNNLAKRPQSNKVLKLLKLQVVQNLMVTKKDLDQWFTSFLIKSLVEVVLPLGLPTNQLANELHRQVIRKFKRRKVYSSFRDNMCGIDLADMKSLSKYNKGIKYLMCAIDLN